MKYSRDVSKTIVILKALSSKKLAEFFSYSYSLKTAPRGINSISVKIDGVVHSVNLDTQATFFNSKRKRVSRNENASGEYCFIFLTKNDRTIFDKAIKANKLEIIIEYGEASGLQTVQNSPSPSLNQSFVNELQTEENYINALQEKVAANQKLLEEKEKLLNDAADKAAQNEKQKKLEREALEALELQSKADLKCFKENETALLNQIGDLTMQVKGISEARSALQVSLDQITKESLDLAAMLTNMNNALKEEINKTAALKADLVLVNEELKRRDAYITTVPQIIEELNKKVVSLMI